MSREDRKAKFEERKKAIQDKSDARKASHNNKTFADIRAEKAERDAERKEKYEATKEQNAADWAAKKDELREDRKDRTLGGWGRKKRSE